MKRRNSEELLKRIGLCGLLTAGLSLQADQVELQLKGGSNLGGRLVKESPEKLWVDIGPTIVELPVDQILKRSRPEDATTEPTVRTTTTSADGLWSAKKNPEARPVEVWVDRLGEGVVEIRSRSGQGSGFIINEDGMVITNQHVIAGDRELTVTVFRNTPQGLKRVQYKNIRIVAIDPARDLALLNIQDELEAPLKWLPMGDSGTIQTGETVFAIGSPLGLDRTVSRGIVSLADRLVSGRLFLQTTAEINPGNSGGPLFNLQGEVVGVNTLKFVRTGIEGVGFSIPSESVKRFLRQRNAYAFDPRNPNTGYHYLNPPRKQESSISETP